MRSRRAVGIAPHGALHDVDAGKLILAFAEEHEQLGVDVDRDGYSLERAVGTVAVLVDDVIDLGEPTRATDGDCEAQEHRIALDGVEVVDDPAIDRDHLDDLVVDNDPAVAVENATPRCLLVDLFEHIGLGPLLEFLALSLESLQIPQSGDEPAEQHERDEGKDPHSEGAVGHRRSTSAASAHAMIGAAIGASTALNAPTTRAITMRSAEIRPPSPTIAPSRA